MREIKNTVTGQNRVIRKKGDLTGAGKGDKLRRGISQNEWNKKWEKIFGKKEKSIRPRKSSNSGSKS